MAFLSRGPGRQKWLSSSSSSSSPRSSPSFIFGDWRPSILLFLLLLSSSLLFSSTHATRNNNNKDKDKNIDGSAPRVKQRYRSVWRVPLGDRVKLRCPIAGDPKPFTIWKINDTEISTADPRVGLRHYIQQFSFAINPVQWEDAGSYRVEAENQFGATFCNFTLIVLDGFPTKLVGGDPDVYDHEDFDAPFCQVPRGRSGLPCFMNPERMRKKMNVIPAGNTLTLRCPAAGNPTPTITWFKMLKWSPYKKEISRDENGYRISHRKWNLNIADLTPGDNGNYTCVIKNKYGSVNYTYIVEVLERIQHRPIIMPGLPKNVTVYEGDDAEFQCVLISDLQPHLQWLKHFQVNGSWSEEVDGRKKFWVKRINNADPETGDPEHIVLKNVTMEDAGRYTCIAGNSIGIAHGSAWLEVLPRDARVDTSTLGVAPTHAFLYDGSAFCIIFWTLLAILILLILIGWFSYSQQKKRFREKEMKMEAMNGDLLSGLHPIQKKNILYNSYFDGGSGNDEDNGVQGQSPHHHHHHHGSLHHHHHYPLHGTKV